MCHKIMLHFTNGTYDLRWRNSRSAWTWFRDQKPAGFYTSCLQKYGLNTCPEYVPWIRAPNTWAFRRDNKHIVSFVFISKWCENFRMLLSHHTESWNVIFNGGENIIMMSKSNEERKKWSANVVFKFFFSNFSFGEIYTSYCLLYAWCLFWTII